MKYEVYFKEQGFEGFQKRTILIVESGNVVLGFTNFFGREHYVIEPSWEFEYLKKDAGKIEVDSKLVEKIVSKVNEIPNIDRKVPRVFWDSDGVIEDLLD